MKKLFLAVVTLAPLMLLAQSPLDGTWKTNLDKSKMSPKPITFSMNGGM